MKMRKRILVQFDAGIKTVLVFMSARTYTQHVTAYLYKDAVLLCAIIVIRMVRFDRIYRYINILLFDYN